MAVVTTKSTAITNRDATPVVLTNSNIAGGRLQASYGYAAIANGDSIASKLILASVPSHARVSSVLLSCAATASATADIGVYRNTRDGGAVVDADFFASAQALTSALVNTEVVGESGEYTTAEREMPLWQALGASVDPKTTYDIVLTLTAAATGAGSAALEVRYVV